MTFIVKVAKYFKKISFCAIFLNIRMKRGKIETGTRTTLANIFLLYHYFSQFLGTLYLTISLLPVRMTLYKKGYFSLTIKAVVVKLQLCYF